MKSDVRLIDSAEETAEAVREILKKESLAREKGRGAHSFFVTDAPERFIKVRRRFLGEKVDSAMRIERCEIGSNLSAVHLNVASREDCSQRPNVHPSAPGQPHYRRPWGFGGDPARPHIRSDQYANPTVKHHLLFPLHRRMP